MTNKKLILYITTCLGLPSISWAIFPGKIAVMTISGFLLLFLSIIIWKKNNKVEFKESLFLKLLLYYQFFVVFLLGILNNNDTFDYIQWLSISHREFIFFIFILPLIFSIRNIYFSIKYYIIIGIIVVFIDLIFNIKLLSNIISLVYLWCLLASNKGKFNFKIIIPFIVLLLFISSNLDNRYNIIQSVFLILTIICVNLFSIRILNIIKNLILLIPIILLSAAIFIDFNVFKYTNDINEDLVISENSSQKILVDSRTGIYLDVFNALDSPEKILFGLKANGRYYTSLTEHGPNSENSFFLKGRIYGESGFLNYLAHGGITTIILLFLFIYKSSSFCLKYARNSLSRMLGIWVSGFWLFLFIENPGNLELDTFLDFLFMGICLNIKFISLSNWQVQYFIKKLQKSFFIINKIL